jgi:tetratricopeptide (TPR) repeat protein
VRGRALIAVCVLALANAAGSAQEHSFHAVPAIPPELLERRISIGAGIGSAHDAVSTASKQAQAFYDQGITYLHSYAWIDAARSFHAALRLDATIAAAHSGLSIALEEVNEPALAQAAIARARALAADASDHDRRHVEIRSLQYAAVTARGDSQARAAYRRAIDDALVAFPSDVELWLLRGVAEAPDASDRGQGGGTAALRFYERALAIQPGHFAAHHYMVHAYENTGQIEEAITHAREYARLAPAVPHAHHMLGHDLRRTGRIGQAIAAFRKAHELETEPARAADVPPQYDWHYQHNLDLLGASYQYVGQMRTAERFLHMSFDTPSPLVVQEFNKHEWPAFLLARGRAADALAAAQELTRSPAGVVRGIGQVMTGRALLALQRVAEGATAANVALDELRAAGPEASLAAPHLQALQAEVLLRTGRREKAIAMFRDARRKIRALPGPDAWSQGLFRLESIGRAALATGAWELAAETADDMEAHDPAYGGTHYLRALVAEHEGDRETAKRHFERAAEAWRDADSDFADRVEALARLQRTLR